MMVTGAIDEALFRRCMPLLFLIVLPVCEKEKPTAPLIGKECLNELDCCAGEEGQCLDGVYCDNSSEPGQCLKICNETAECEDPVLGDFNICVQFDFGGRCMRWCRGDEDCSRGTSCHIPDDIDPETRDRVCYPGYWN